MPNQQPVLLAVAYRSSLDELESFQVPGHGHLFQLQCWLFELLHLPYLFWED